MRKERTQVKIEIDIQWTNNELNKLKKLADDISDGLYPDVILPLVETDDIADHYLKGYMPLALTGTMPYTSWCMHKYPPYQLKIDESIAVKYFKACWNELPEQMCPSPVAVPIECELDSGLLAFQESSRLTFQDLSDQPILYIEQRFERLDDIDRLFQDIHLKEDAEFNKQYDEDKLNFIRDRKELLIKTLNNLSKNSLVEYFNEKTNFNKIFDQFYSDFQIDAKENTKTAESIIKYRFLLHIIILFLRVAGCKHKTDYTPEVIKVYKNKVKSDVLSSYTNIRKRLESTPVNTTLPNKRDLESIHNHAEILFDLLHGRTANHDLMMHLDSLISSTTDDFDIQGRLATQTNVDLRSFIKSTARFISLYYYQYLMAYSVALTDKEFEDEFTKFIISTNKMVTSLTDMFFYNVKMSTVKTNTSEIFKEIKELIIYNKKSLQIKPFLQSVSKGKSKVASIASFIAENFVDEQNTLNMDSEILHFIKNTSDPRLTVNEQTKKIRFLIQRASGSHIWPHIFEYFGRVNQFEGSVTLHKIKQPIFSEVDLEIGLARARALINERKIQILSGSE